MPRSCRPRAQFSVKGEPHGPKCGWVWRKRRPNLSEPVKCSQHLTGFRWCSVRSAVWQPAKPLRAFCRCSRASNDTGAPCNPIRGRAAGWCARGEKTPAQCCVRLAGHEGAMSQRVRLAGPIPRQCSYYDCNRPSWCIWSDEEKRWLRDLAARHVPHGTCLKGSGPMLGLSFDAEQGFWWSVCIHGRSRYCRLLKNFCRRYRKIRA